MPVFPGAERTGEVKEIPREGALLVKPSWKGSRCGRDQDATMRRAPVPRYGPRHGMISEAELPLYTAIVRLAAGDRIKGMGVLARNVACRMAAPTSSTLRRARTRATR